MLDDVVFSFSEQYEKDACWDPSVSRVSYCYGSPDLELQLEQWFHSSGHVTWHVNPRRGTCSDVAHGHIPIVFQLMDTGLAEVTYGAHRGSDTLILKGPASGSEGEWVVLVSSKCEEEASADNGCYAEEEASADNGCCAEEEASTDDGCCAEGCGGTARVVVAQAKRRPPWRP
jgi:hypothetical protein